MNMHDFLSSLAVLSLPVTSSQLENEDVKVNIFLLFLVTFSILILVLLEQQKSKKETSAG